ncbi:MAG: hypothetical protein AABW73_01615 [Nanoarchaeota archaeon]
MKRVNHTIIIVTIIALLSIALYINSDNKEKTQIINDQEAKTTKTFTSPTYITYKNFEPVMSKMSIIKDVPEEYPIQLKFFNFNTGIRQWEKSYIISSAGVKEGTIENPELTVVLNSKYLQGLTTANFCSAISLAKKNGDLGIESESSSISLAIKYKSLIKHKDCLG